MGKILEL